MYYVYEWYRADLNLPYYIGKGKGKRAYDLKRNKHTDAVTKHLTQNGIRRCVRILAYFLTEEAAIDFEIERIAFWNFLKEHKILTNQTIGGEGVSGYKHGPEQILKMSAAAKGKAKSIETRKKMSANNWTRASDASAKLSSLWTDSRKKEQSKRSSGANNPMFGKKGPLSPSFGRVNGPVQREAARLNGLKRTGENNPNYGKITTDEIKAKLSKSNKGQIRSEEAKAKMRKPRSEEGRAAIAASNRDRAEKKRLEKIYGLPKGDI